VSFAFVLFSGSFQVSSVHDADEKQIHETTRKRKTRNNTKAMKVHTSLIALLLLVVAQPGCSRLSKAPPDPTADNLTLTSLLAPLPREAFKTEIAFAYGPPAGLRAGEKRSIHLLVKNSSAVLWPYGGKADGQYQVRLGNRWVDQQGTASDDGRALLSYDLRPGDTAEVAITVNAPRTSGKYILEFDMVQEQVAWFRDMGSEPLQLSLAVE
jgi:hypothetical protein